MNIYRSIHYLSMGISLPEYDGEGNLVEVHKLDFTNGQTSPKFIGGSVAVKDPKIIELLEKSPRNKKNGGADWYLEKVIDESAKVEKQPKKATEAPVSSPEEPSFGDTVVTEEDPGFTDYPEVTTNPLAVAKLRELDPSIKTAEVRNRTQINEAAAKLKISFSNL